MLRAGLVTASTLCFAATAMGQEEMKLFIDAQKTEAMGKIIYVYGSWQGNIQGTEIRIEISPDGKEESFKESGKLNASNPNQKTFNGQTAEQKNGKYYVRASYQIPGTKNYVKSAAVQKEVKVCCVCPPPCPPCSPAEATSSPAYSEMDARMVAASLAACWSLGPYPAILFVPRRDSCEMD